MTARIPLRILALALVAVLACTASALGATRHGITPLAPKSGATVARGKSPTFKMRVKGPGQVSVHVCKSKKKDRQGVICSTESIGRAKKVKGHVFRYKPRFFDFPTFWLNTPGTYYWQAFRISCEGGDCEQEGPVVKFKVG
jgi:hypothetical protein